MQNNKVTATEAAEKQHSGGKARLTAYMQGMKKIRAQIQKEAEKGGAKE